MWRIFVPLQYLKIDHPEKWKFDWGIPLVFAVFFASPLLSSEFRAEGAAGLNIVEKISSFLGVLTGFYIAALAAVATFGKAEMDDPMPGEPGVRLEHRVNTEIYMEKLSRRRFLSFLFGYMALVTLALYVLGYVYMVLDKYALSGTSLHVPVFVAFWIVYSFSLANVLANTLLGLFYLTDRIHRPNRTVQSNDGSQDSM
ncbi:hypothetical protein [Rhodopseudomonas sp. BR0M22]|uniref:hypothetical protein n=1 Tax=Rhodopseudomonas sp. BR0M22 TaxID=2269369 RepID=UPI0013DF35FD|nr:hypothetical protein [Rhodopseudomonas sp. BR0M22]NEW92995.1 hypothetical protein [Rhodopseudomonas sp. BR0M22]